MDITDAFDAISSYEETLVAQGEAMGVERGRELGIEEGRELGVMKGAEIGSELGFYQGCYLVWNYMLQNEELKSKLPCVVVAEDEVVMDSIGWFAELELPSRWHLLARCSRLLSSRIWWMKTWCRSCSVFELSLR